MVGGGTGSFFASYHRAAMRLSGRWDLVAGAFSSDMARSVASGSALGVAPDRVYRDADALAEGEAGRPDGARTVAVVTPNALHFEQCKVSLERGLNVICDKPLVNELEEAWTLHELAKRKGVFFGVTFTYPGYPMVREARSRIARGDLGRIKFAYAEYLQEWVAEDPRNLGAKGGSWRSDPNVAGPTGTMADVGTHAQSVLEFLLGTPIEAVSARLSTSTGRAIDDRAILMLRFSEGTEGLIWADQALPGHRNGLRVKVAGETATLEWRQEAPETLWIGTLGGADQILHRGQKDMAPEAMSYVTFPAGVPEGYLEALGILYADFADAVETPDQPGPFEVPDIVYGLRGVALCEAALTSNGKGGAWTPVGIGNRNGTA
jgi:predicted dehydrogenase